MPCLLARSNRPLTAHIWDIRFCATSAGESRLVAQINYTHLATNLYTRKARLSERSAPRELIPRPPPRIDRVHNRSCIRSYTAINRSRQSQSQSRRKRRARVRPRPRRTTTAHQVSLVHPWRALPFPIASHRASFRARFAKPRKMVGLTARRFLPRPLSSPRRTKAQRDTKMTDMQPESELYTKLKVGRRGEQGLPPRPSRQRLPRRPPRGVGPRSGRGRGLRETGSRR